MNHFRNILHKDKSKKQFVSSSVNGGSKVTLEAWFKDKAKYVYEKKSQKGMNCFYGRKLGRKAKFCRKQLWDKKNN